MNPIEKLKNRRGFTLAELLMVVAIIAILAGIAVAFVNPKQITAIEYDRSAESIAVAAQNRLTTLRNEGDMTTLQTLGERSDEAVGKLASAAAASASGGYRYLFNRGADGAPIVNENNIGIEYILPFGAIETELAQNYFAIGFQSDTGMIGEVFYSPQPFKAFTVAYLLELQSDADKRKADGVGYYQGAVDEREVAFVNLPTPQLTITNYEELKLNIYLPEVTQLASAGKQIGFVVSLSDEAGEAYSTAGLTLDETAIYSTFSLGEKVEFLDSVVTRQSISSGTTYSLILDTVKKVTSADMQVSLTSNTPTGKFEDWAKRSKAVKSAENPDGVFLLGENSVVTVTVYCLYDYNQDFPIDPTFMPRSASVAFNGWFDNYTESVKDGETVGSVNIACGRHLQNLGKFTQIKSNLKPFLPTVKEENGKYTYSDYDYGKALVYTDGSSNVSPKVSYDDITEKFERTKNTANVKYATQVKAIDFDSKEWKDSKGNPIPFEPLYLPYSFYYYGNYLTISDLYVDAPFYAGLIGYSYHAHLYDILLVDPKVNSQMPAQLAELYEMGVGALIGTSRHSSAIYNCQAYMTEKNGAYDATRRVTGEGYVGGLIGFCEDETIQNCSASVYTGYQKNDTRSSMYVGGLIGAITGDSTVSTCYAAGNLTGVYVGGLVGFILEDSDPSGDDYRINACYTAGHIEYAAKNAAGILGKIRYYTGNAKSAVSVYGNYCVVIYGEKETGGSGVSYKWNSTAPVYGTFEGDGFTWLRTDSFISEQDEDGMYSPYLTGDFDIFEDLNDKGEPIYARTFFAGAVFKNDNKNYYIPQKGIDYESSSYFTAAKDTVSEFLENSESANDSALLSAAQTAEKKLEYAKNLQTLKEMKTLIDDIIDRVEKVTGNDADGNPYQNGGFYKYGTTFYLTTNRACLEGYDRTGDDGHGIDSYQCVAIPGVLQTLYAICHGKYTDANGKEQTVEITCQENDRPNTETKDKDGKYYNLTFDAIYKRLEEAYTTLISNPDDADAKKVVEDAVGDRTKESSYRKGYLYSLFDSEMLYQLFDKAKDYYQTTKNDKTGELIYRNFREMVTSPFRDLECDLGLTPNLRTDMLNRAKVEELDETIQLIGHMVAEKGWLDHWTGNMKSHVASTKQKLNSILTIVEKLKNYYDGKTVLTAKERTDTVAQAETAIKELYGFFDSSEIKNIVDYVPDISSSTGKWKGEGHHYSSDNTYYEQISSTSSGDRGMRLYRDWMQDFLNAIKLSEATANSGAVAVLDDMISWMQTSSSSVTNDMKHSWFETLKSYVNAGSDSGIKVYSAKELREVVEEEYVRVGLDETDPKSYDEKNEWQNEMRFMYDYALKYRGYTNPYRDNGSMVWKDKAKTYCVDLDPGVYNNVFPYEIPEEKSKFYPFPFVFGRTTTSGSKTQFLFVLFHYGDWLYEDLWADQVTTSLSEAVALMGDIKGDLQAIRNQAGNNGSTGNLDKKIDALFTPIDSCVKAADHAFASDSAAAKQDLKTIGSAISGWLADKGTFTEILSAYKENKAIGANVKLKLESYRKELKALNKKINDLVGGA